ncbi:hypothetical protein SLEP1_g52374 [Rubroshorea leprosula]|uniref:Uncharacterized protein n=1 Tax=Rubroshorea leprosula TaxID=152421 RepID=A0AAV5M8Q8_9ROSI|nr:hypothetical protein SLEP1_g52374 [Rubroshorea leprosula]
MHYTKGDDIPSSMIFFYMPISQTSQFDFQQALPKMSIFKRVNVNTFIVS